MDKQISEAKGIAVTTEQLNGIKSFYNSKLGSVVEEMAPAESNVDVVSAGLSALMPNAPVAPAEPVAEAPAAPTEPAPVEEPVAPVEEASTPNMFDVPPVVETPAEPVVEAPAPEAVSDTNMFDAPPIEEPVAQEPIIPAEEVSATNMFDSPAPEAPVEPAPTEEVTAANLFDAPVPETPAEPVEEPVAEEPTEEMNTLPPQDQVTDNNNIDAELVEELKALGQDFLNLYVRYDSILERIGDKNLNKEVSKHM